MPKPETFEQHEVPLVLKFYQNSIHSSPGIESQDKKNQNPSVVQQPKANKIIFTKAKRMKIYNTFRLMCK
jgi:hypothetical protein